jgi:hypothetical protein
MLFTPLKAGAFGVYSTPTVRSGVVLVQDLKASLNMVRLFIIMMTRVFSLIFLSHMY